MGDGTFQSAVNYAAGIEPFSVVSCDFNGDGYNDLATANSGSDNVSILLNLTGPYGCCMGEIRGNVDYDVGDAIDISDLVYLVDYMFNGGSAPVCEDEANINGAGEIDISDLVYIVDYMFNGGPAPAACP